MRGCGKWALISPEKTVKPFYCNSGSCKVEKCRLGFWKRRIRLIGCLIEEYGLYRFFTLTLDRRGASSAEDAWDYIHYPWSKFRKRMNRKFTGFLFVAVLESHKNGFPHIHGFTSIWMLQREYSRIWRECGGGPVVWVSAVEKYNDISEYVSKQLNIAKYVGKENLWEGYKNRGKHRSLWRSKNLKAKFELTKEKGWSIIKEYVFDGAGNQIKEIW